MPSKKIVPGEYRRAFVEAALAGVEPMSSLCRRHAISRVTGYKWLARFREGGAAALADRSHRPQAPRGPREVKTKWLKQAVALRRRRTTWGVRKLWEALRRAHPQAQLPSRSTLWRYLREEGLITPQPARRRAGLALPRSAAPVAERANDVWTMDFKGNFRVGTGALCQPFTVRDLWSRYVLAVEHVAALSDELTRTVLTRLFQRYGLPRAILVDNGVPFAGVGALGLTRLSVWWRRLGIAVHFTRRGKPQDNGAHEQMHRILKAETTKPPAPTLRGQQRRFERWREDYNDERPHENLGGRAPMQLYYRSRRAWHVPEPLRYRCGWSRVCVDKDGRIRWQGRKVRIGRAFVGEWIGLKPCAQTNTETIEIYLGADLIGQLDPSPAQEIRPAQYAGTSRRRSRKILPRQG